MNRLKDNPSSLHRRTKRLRPTPFLFLALLLLLTVLAYSLGWTDYLSFQGIKEYRDQIQVWVQARPIQTACILWGAYVLAIALSLPGAAILSLLTGFLFPQPWSSLLVITAATMGATLIFFAAKSAIGEILRRKAGSRLQAMETGFKKNAVEYLLFLRFLPVFPFWLLSLPMDKSRGF